MKNKPIILIQVYQKWYKQRKDNKQESFDEWLDKNITFKQPFNDQQTKHIKRALINAGHQLEKEDWRLQWQILILVREHPAQ